MLESVHYLSTGSGQKVGGREENATRFEGGEKISTSFRGGEKPKLTSN